MSVLSVFGHTLEKLRPNKSSISVAQDLLLQYSYSGKFKLSCYGLLPL